MGYLPISDRGQLFVPKPPFAVAGQRWRIPPPRPRNKSDFCGTRLDAGLLTNDDFLKNFNSGDL
jgi:hypothetical protein